MAPVALAPPARGRVDRRPADILVSGPRSPVDGAPLGVAPANGYSGTAGSWCPYAPTCCFRAAAVSATWDHATTSEVGRHGPDDVADPHISARRRPPRRPSSLRRQGGFAHA